ncbi:MAG TPA: ABC transporter permease [Candidatus Limnocylindria bacterium]|nr:ABC transporter permease [Candidatus Limnocylindria bacterium]
MSASRVIRLVWFVTWFNVRMLLASEFFILTTFISPLIFATLAFFLFQSGGGTAGQTLLYVALGAGMMGVWSTTLFGCGGAIAWQRWEGTLELLVSAPSRYDFILVGQTFGAVVLGFYGIVATLAWGVLLFGMPIEATFPLVLPLSLLAAIVSLGSLGMLIATTFVLYRHANALGNLLEYPIWLITGLLVPISVLPLWIKPISYLLAPTWGMEAIRGATIGAEPPLLAIAMCFILACAYYVAARYTLVFVLDKARRDATLALQ